MTDDTQGKASPPRDEQAAAVRSELIERLEGLDDLPTLPAVATRVMELSRSEEVTIRDLKQVIMTDPPLTAKLLKIANSAYYGRRVKATTIDQAVVTIGLDSLIDVCATMGVLESFSAWEEKHISREMIWRHALGTAFLAKSLEIRKAMQKDDGPDMFLAGLLHSIGWIVLDHVYPDKLKQLLEKAEQDEGWDVAYEREVVGLDVAHVGAIFLERWGLPGPVVEVVRHQHEPEEAGEEEAHAGLLGLAAWLSPFEFRFAIPVERLNEQIPAMIEEEPEEELGTQLRQRYDSHIQQARILAERMIDFI